MLQELIQLANGTEFGRDVQELVQFVGLGARGGIKLGVRDGDRAKTGNGGNQRFLLPAESAPLPGVHEDGTLSLGGAKRRGHQHPRRDHISQRMRGWINSNANGLAGGNGTHRQVSREVQPLAVVASPHGCCGLRGFSRNCAQAERGALAQQNADQPGVKQDPQPIGYCFHHGVGVGHGVQCLRDLRQNLGAAMLLAGYPGQAARLQQTA